MSQKGLYTGDAVRPLQTTGRKSVGVAQMGSHHVSL